MLANFVVWSQVFDAHRRIMLGAGISAVRGRVRREVDHDVANCPIDLSRDLVSIEE